MKSRRQSVVAALAAGALLLAACGGDDDTAATTEAPAVEESAAPAPETVAEAEETTAPAVEETTAPEEVEETTAPTEPAAAEGWVVNTDDCVDPDAANAPIEGTIKIGSAMPLTGGVAAAAFAPVKEGFDAYMKYANENGLVDGYTIEWTIEDDQYNAELTPGAVAKQIDGGAHLFSGIIGSPNNAAVRDILNDECIPQLAALTGSPAWGEVADYPWTTGQLVPYTVESAVYAAQIAEQFPDGATVALFHVSNEFGQIYAEAFKEVAPEFNLEIVAEETIEATDSNPPTSQITNIAALKPDVIMAVPLGAGCIGFLTELANAKAANAGWEPPLYLTNTCASSLILGAAGPAANGLITSSNAIDVADPANASIPSVKTYLDYMNGLGKGDLVATAVAGWTTAETTVAVLAQAAASPEGLTRASIINAARNFTLEASLSIPGVTFKMSGEEDAFLAESLVVRQYDATTATFKDIGELIADFES